MQVLSDDDEGPGDDCRDYEHEMEQNSEAESEQNSDGNHEVQDVGTESREDIQKQIKFVKDFYSSPSKKGKEQQNSKEVIQYSAQETYNEHRQSGGQDED